MDAIEIRAYHKDDKDAVIALWNKVFTDEPVWNASSELIERKLTVQRELFFIASIDVHVVGTVIAGFDGVRGWVHKVAAHPDYRRAGIARKLMSHAEQALSNIGCTKLNLQVREGNDSAVLFYQSAGYRIEPRTSMSKQLHPIE